MEKVTPLCKRVAVFVASEFYRHRNQSPFWDLLLTRLRHETAGRGWQMSLHFSGGREGTYFLESDPTGTAGAAQDRAFMGVIAIGMQSHSVKWMLERGIPVATFSGSGSPIGVEMDQFEFIRLGVAELAKMGVKRPAFFKPLTALRPFCLDDWAYRQADYVQSVWRDSLNQNGLEYVPEFFRNLTGEGLAKRESHPPVLKYQAQGAITAQEVFSRDDIPDGFVSVDDTFTQGALITLREQFPEILSELHIATQSNEGSPILWCEENLIRLQVSPKEIARHLCDSLQNSSVIEDLGCFSLQQHNSTTQSGRILLSPTVVLPSSMVQ